MRLRSDRTGSATSRAASRIRGIEPVHYDPADVIVPPFLPDTPACRAELAQYYESISRVDAGLGRLDRDPQTGRQVRRHADHLHLRQRHAVSRCEDDRLRARPAVALHRAKSTFAKTRRRQRSDGELGRYHADDSRFRRRRAGRGHCKLHGRSFLPILEQENPSGWDEMYASHTFHEVTMYYPMRVVRSGRYKLIWNIAHPLPFPFASDLWNSATWQTARRRGPASLYGKEND